MCAQFVLKINANVLSKKFGISIPETLETFDLRVRGFIKTEQAPVIFSDFGKLKFKMMSFSLCPSWSQEFPYKWSSYNARMERPKADKNRKPIFDKAGRQISEYIYQVPTWRDSFAKGRLCLVPLNAAIESSYFGSHAGQIIQFSTQEDEPFYCLGLWDQWLDKQTGELKESFALLTDDPYEFFFRAGHDRSVLIVNDKSYDELLNNSKLTPKARFDLIRENRTSLNWKVETERSMAKGWEKKAPTSLEISNIKVWK
jgi:putative SOS response-associated peptidase YedK